MGTQYPFHSLCSCHCDLWQRCWDSVFGIWLWACCWWGDSLPLLHWLPQWPDERILPLQVYCQWRGKIRRCHTVWGSILPPPTHTSHITGFPFSYSIHRLLMLVGPFLAGMSQHTKQHLMWFLLYPKTEWLSLTWYVSLCLSVCYYCINPLKRNHC